MFKKTLWFCLLLAASTAWAQDVTVTLLNAQVKQGKFIGANTQNVYLESDGRAVKIPKRDLRSVIDSETGAPVPVETQEAAAADGDWARAVLVTFQDGKITRGKLIGHSGPWLYLESDGQAVKLPVSGIKSVQDAETGAETSLRSDGDADAPESPAAPESPKPEERFAPGNALTLRPTGFMEGVTILGWETRLTDTATFAARAILPGVPEMSLADSGGLGLGYRLFLFTPDPAIKGFSLGPCAEGRRYFRDERWYWNAGAEAGYHWVFGRATGFVLSLQGSVVYENAYSGDFTRPGIRTALDLDLGLGF